MCGDCRNKGHEHELQRVGMGDMFDDDAEGGDKSKAGAAAGAAQGDGMGFRPCMRCAYKWLRLGLRDRWPTLSSSSFCAN